MLVWAAFFMEEIIRVCSLCSRATCGILLECIMQTVSSKI